MVYFPHEVCLFLYVIRLFHLKLHSIRWQWTKDPDLIEISIDIVLDMLPSFLYSDAYFLINVEKCLYTKNVLTSYGLFVFLCTRKQNGTMLSGLFFIFHYWHIQCHKWLKLKQKILEKIFHRVDDLTLEIDKLLVIRVNMKNSYKHNTYILICILSIMSLCSCRV